MKPSIATDRWYLPVFILLLGIHVFWMAHLRLYPFVDYPYHLAESTIYRHYEEPGNKFSSYYSKEVAFRPNIIHLLFSTSTIFPNVETAYRIYFCLYVILLPVSMHLLIRQLGGAIWFSLLSFLMLYNFNVHWGFVGYMLSIPAFLIFFSLLLRYLRRNEIILNVTLALWFVLIFLIHPLTALFSLVVFFLSCLWEYKLNWKLFAKKILVAVPILLIIGEWWFLGDSHGEQWTAGFVLHYYTGNYLDTLLQRITLLVNDNKFLFPGMVGMAVAFVLSIFILVPLIFPLGAFWSRFRIERNGSSIMPVYVLVLSSLCCWLFLPGYITGQFYVFDRFSVFFMLSLITLCAATFPYSLNKAVKAWIVTGCLLYSILWSNYFYEFEKEASSFTKKVLPSRSEETLCGMIYDREFRGRKVYQHFLNYHIVWNKGIACSGFIDFKVIPAIGRKASLSRLPKYIGTIGSKNDRYVGQYRNVDYLLVRSKSKASTKKVIDNFRLIRSSGPWFLYQKMNSE